MLTIIVICYPGFPTQNRLIETDALNLMQFPTLLNHFAMGAVESVYTEISPEVPVEQRTKCFIILKYYLVRNMELIQSCGIS